MKKIIYCLFLTILCISTLGCSFKTVYGNTDEEILNYIKTYKSSIKGNINAFKIVDTIYIEDTKIVGFLSDSYNGILVYEKDKNNNYVYKSMEFLGENEMSGLSIVRIAYDSIEGNENIGWVIFSYGGSASKIELTINNTYNFSSDLSLNKPSLTLIKEDIPSQESKAIKVNYKYYDVNNKEHSLPQRIKLW